MDQQKRAEYVERWARTVEGQGETRISGRIYAHLATAEEPYLSLQELADQLGVSRASISTNTRRLIDLGMVSRVAVPGSRGEHYALDLASTEGMLARAAQAARVLEALAGEGLALQPKAITPGTQSLRAMADIYHRIADTIEQGIADTGRKRPGSKRASR